MRDLQDKFGLTYLFISHNLAVVRHMASRIGVMYLGRIVEIAPARELFASPRMPYTKMLLGAVPDLAMSGASGFRSRRDPQSDQSAARLRLQSALPAGVRSLPPGGARADRRRRLPCGQPTGRGGARMITQMRANRPIGSAPSLWSIAPTSRRRKNQFP